MEENRELLLQFIERVERLMEERSAIGDDIKQIFLEAKGEGFDPKAMREVIAMRAMPKEVVEEQEAIVRVYWSALGN